LLLQIIPWKSGVFEKVFFSYLKPLSRAGHLDVVTFRQKSRSWECFFPINRESFGSAVPAFLITTYSGITVLALILITICFVMVVVTMILMMI